MLLLFFFFFFSFKRKTYEFSTRQLTFRRRVSTPITCCLPLQPRSRAQSPDLTSPNNHRTIHFGPVINEGQPHHNSDGYVTGAKRTPVTRVAPRQQQPTPAQRPPSPLAAASNHIPIHHDRAAAGVSRRRASERRALRFRVRPPGRARVAQGAGVPSHPGARARPPHGAAARYPDPSPIPPSPAGGGGEAGWRAAGG
jgi:hypothetical protein